MDTKLLKQKILDLAIHGKLVPQNPNDESATVLLEKIRAEKAEKIKKGELKADKKDSFIFVGDDNRHYEKFADGTVKDIEDEIPFDVPEGWSWCRLRELPTFIGDGDWIESKDQSENGIRLIQTGNVGFGKFRDKEGKYHFISEETFDKLSCCEIFSGDILISRLPEPVGRSCIIPETNSRMITAVDCTILRLNEKLIQSEYFVYYTQSTKYMELIKQSCTGTTRLRISRANLEKILLPLPPREEQCLILNEINHYFSFIELIEKDKDELSSVIKQAKSKILDLAIHGKLVPQDPSDEPASVLLEKLRAEKEAKIKAGELKRDKNDSYIYKNTTDNCYYEKFADGTEEQVELPATIPDSWVWCHFGDVADVINGKNQSKVEDESGIYPIYGSGGIMGRANDYICPENCTIIGRKGSINNPIFVEEKFWNVDTAFGLAPSTGVLPKYLFYFCKSFDFTSLDSSTTLPSLTKTNIQQILFPLPSLPEQHRILNKIESLFTKLDEIALNLV